MTTQSPRIALTLGDPAGIGPEITARALAACDQKARDRFLVFCDEPVLQQALSAIDQTHLKVSTVHVGTLSLDELQPGSPSPATGRAQIAYLEAAVRAAHRGEISAMVTAPISKASAQEAGFAFPGHTEYLADAFSARHVAMMFAGPRLKVVLATVHESLQSVPRLLSSERILRTGRLAIEALQRDFDIPGPTVGVLGLNPHAGEGGRFGREEELIIQPAIERLREACGDSVRIEGPLVPDAAFRRDFDLFIAMYHDQGLIPVKLIDFERAVNTTLGLPIVRTSPDHGVAYDIAGKGCARPTSMKAAMDLALQLVDQRFGSRP